MKKLSTFISFILCIFITLSLCACSPAQYSNAGVLTDKYTSDGMEFDIYYPTNRIYDKNPVFIYFHGGGWVSGDKNEINESLSPLLEGLRENGFIVISANYTFANAEDGISMYDCVSDAIDCVEYFCENSEKYDIDSNNIIVGGYSAGAYLAMMASFANESDFFSGEYTLETPYKVKMCVDIAGPVVFYDLSTEDEYSDYRSEPLDFYSNIVTDYTSETLYDDLHNRNPLNYIEKKHSIIDMLILRGSGDTVVPQAHANDAFAAANMYKLDTSMIEVENMTHIFTPHDTSKPMGMTINEMCGLIVSRCIDAIK